MGSECDVVAVIEGAAGTETAACWAAVEALTYAFWGTIEPGHEIADAELDLAEHDLGIQLPPALRDGYRQFGRLPLLSSQDRLIEPDRLTLRPGGEVVFRTENQGCAWWSCSLAEGDNSSVRIWRTDTHVDAGTVSQFFVHMVLSELVLAARHVTDLDQWFDMPEVPLRPLSLPAFAWWPSPDLSPRRFFGGDGLILARDPTPWLWGAATSEHKLDELTAALLEG